MLQKPKLQLVAVGAVTGSHDCTSFYAQIGPVRPLGLHVNTTRTFTRLQTFHSTAPLSIASQASPLTTSLTTSCRQRVAAIWWTDFRCHSSFSEPSSLRGQVLRTIALQLTTKTGKHNQNRSGQQLDLDTRSSIATHGFLRR